MLQAHYDEIWGVGPMVWAEEPGSNDFMYVATYNVSFWDMDEFTDMWTEVAFPILQENLDNGTLNGAVLLEHNTGGSHNWKVMYLTEEWDHIDDVLGNLISTTMQDHPKTWDRMMDVVEAHDDEIWVPVTRDGTLHTESRGRCGTAANACCGHALSVGTKRSNFESWISGADTLRLNNA